VRFTLVLGVAASVAANVLHARPDPVAQIIAAWPPLALLLTVELISRVPVVRRLLAAARLVATTGIAAIAAWVSYWHMAGVAARYGEQGASPFLLPLSVDGLVIVASVSLVELAGRIRTTHPAAAQVGTSVAPATSGPNRQPVPSATSPAVAEAVAADRRTDAQPAAVAYPRPGGRPTGETTADEPAAAPAPSHPVPARQTTNGQPTHTVASSAPAGADRVVVAPPDGPVPDRPPADPKAAVAYWRANDPSLRPAEIAARVGRSERTVRRILAGLPDTADDPADSDGTGATARVNGAASTLADSIISS